MTPSALLPKLEAISRRDAVPQCCLEKCGGGSPSPAVVGSDVLLFKPGLALSVENGHSVLVGLTPLKSVSSFKHRPAGSFEFTAR